MSNTRPRLAFWGLSGAMSAFVVAVALVAGGTAQAHATTCIEYVNPSGGPAGQPGPPGGTSVTPILSPHQNPDGFYRVNVTGGITTFFVLSGGVSFGPFPTGSTIKYTQSGSDTARMETIGGPNSAVIAHIIGPDEFITYPAGEPTHQTICYVPPPPTHP